MRPMNLSFVERPCGGVFQVSHGKEKRRDCASNPLLYSILFLVGKERRSSNQKVELIYPLFRRILLPCEAPYCTFIFRRNRQDKVFSLLLLLRCYQTPSA
eukprot:scaffold9544_cov97-Cylindrotheca_fusiformis.AAC.5